VWRNVLKSKELFFIESVQVEFHHGGEGGNVFVFGLLTGIVALAELFIILVKEE